jgi:hypothetical protein
VKSPLEPQFKLIDPYFGNEELPLSATCYPAGFPLEVSTNSSEVIESVNESWGRWSPGFDRPPLRLRVRVDPQGALAPPPSFRRQGHLFCVVSDADNFAVADLRLLQAGVFTSARTAADHAWLRWFFIETMGYVLLSQRYAVPVHAACVAAGASGVLLCGPSGAGKSTLSFACARAGWTFLTDDATWLLPEGANSIAIGRPHQARFRPDAPHLFPELERFSERVRPNGKLTLEVPLEQFPRIRTATQCEVGTLVLLDRSDGAAARLERIPSVEVVEFLQRDAPSYGEEVDRLREQTVGKLRSVPAYRLSYQRLDEALELLPQLKN